MAARKYTLRKRAKQQEETRRKIVEAAMKLHEEVGPANTTVSGIAERAGVERLTVYRHFPDQDDILHECSALFLEKVPPPDPGEWSQIEDPSGRTRAALASFYDYYRGTERMWASVLRDRDEIDPLAEVIDEFDKSLDRVRDDLARHWTTDRSQRRTIRGLIGHALHFPTWKSMRAQGFGNRKIAELMTAWIESTVE